MLAFSTCGIDPVGSAASPAQLVHVIGAPDSSSTASCACRRSTQGARLDADDFAAVRHTEAIIFRQLDLSLPERWSLKRGSTPARLACQEGELGLSGVDAKELLEFVLGRHRGAAARLLSVLQPPTGAARVFWLTKRKTTYSPLPPGFPSPRHRAGAGRQRVARAARRRRRPRRRSEPAAADVRPLSLFIRHTGCGEPALPATAASTSR